MFASQPDIELLLHFQHGCDLHSDDDFDLRSFDVMLITDEHGRMYTYCDQSVRHRQTDGMATI